jgi:exonuclease VII small subunit
MSNSAGIDSLNYEQSFEELQKLIEALEEAELKVETLEKD